MLSRMKKLPELPVDRPRRVVSIVTACVAIIIIPLLIFLGYFLYQSHELRSSQRVKERIFEARLAAAPSRPSSTAFANSGPGTANPRKSGH